MASPDSPERARVGARPTTEDEVARYLILNGKGWHDEDGPTTVDGIDADVGLGYPVKYHWKSGGAGADSVAGFIDSNYLPVSEVVRLMAPLLTAQLAESAAALSAAQGEAERLRGELAAKEQNRLDILAQFEALNRSGASDAAQWMDERDAARKVSKMALASSTNIAAERDSALAEVLAVREELREAKDLIREVKWDLHDLIVLLGLMPSEHAHVRVTLKRCDAFLAGTAHPGTPPNELCSSCGMFVVQRGSLCTNCGDPRQP